MLTSDVPQYLTLFDSPSDVVLLLPSSSLLSALHSNPLNVLTLIHFCTTSLFSLLTNPSFPQGELANEALNAVRVLSRVVPLVLAPRQAGAVDEVEEELFWRKEKVPARKDVAGESLGGEEPKTGDAEGQFVLEDEDDEGLVTANPLTSASASSPAAQPEQQPAFEKLPPLAERLLGALVDLLFVPGFTLPESSRAGADSSIVTYSIWCVMRTPAVMTLSRGLGLMQELVIGTGNPALPLPRLLILDRLFRSRPSPPASRSSASSRSSSPSPLSSPLPRTSPLSRTDGAKHSSRVERQATATRTSSCACCARY